jgi:hypothetical protein
VGAWRSGERQVGEVLDGTEGIVVLHDRRIPIRRANIDHIAVAPSAVWVIDAKRYLNVTVEHHDASGWFRTDERLRVGGRDRTKLVEAMQDQIEVISNLLTGAGTALAVKAMICFRRLHPGVLCRAFLVRGVAVAWPLALTELLTRPGPNDADTLQQVARGLATALPTSLNLGPEPHRSTGSVSSGTPGTERSRIAHGPCTDPGL